ncbi:two-partner secretion domain-containing protein [Aerosakkonema funiforme]|uniref:Filamentous hemagglutinin N-terminal domain-containing protein n=1 Tax=Aerosakkonema funiforme FACHB-1375 TaxID=2949571 RepID=A0A926VFE8_9CYAN|nr:filamentous hemagglutinin N-terminal domain-containing protein [Aerosakkonema funiforme]MBD2182875.1 filamentous hemagglutinin N-terminal domain-containing protein [Aerosakkonema funiforme FACHB-1375]
MKFISLLVLPIVLLLDAPVSSQILSDRTVGTTVTPNVETNTDRIDGGTIRGSNLFHSFQEFNIESGRSVYFSNPAGIINIFTRIIGGNPSNINGTLGILGNANLFLLNPNGIIFGPNARLNINGSFVASTANSFKFADGSLYGITNPTTSPVLTISTPIGLQLGANAGPIKVEGINSAGLALPTGQTLALVGGAIVITGGNLAVPDGRVELWAVRNAEVGFNNFAQWQLSSPTTAADWGTISLQRSSLIDASGNDGGAIAIRGRGLTIEENSHILSNTVSGQGRGISVQTTEFVDLFGTPAPVQFPPYHGIATSVSAPPDSGLRADGRAGDVTIATGRLRVLNGVFIQSSSSGDGSKTGNITIRATDVEVKGYNPFPSPFFFEKPGDFMFLSTINTLIFGGTGESGKLSIEAERVRLLDGARISADVLGAIGAGANGTAGNISIRASESLEISGYAPNGVTSGVFSGVQPGTTGQGGRIAIDTGRMLLSNGGTISTGLSGTGNAGDIEIKAIDVQLSDAAIDGFSKTLSGITVAVGPLGIGQGGNISLDTQTLHVFNGGQITSSTLGNGAAGNINLQADRIDIEGISQPLADGRQLPSSITAASTTTANAGSIALTANILNLRDRGEISVSNTGGGDAGNLHVDANRIDLEAGNSLRSEVAAGNRGNITLNANSLLMRGGSEITTNATGTATGGNIAISTDTLTDLENSDITANALQGQGGNIQIATQAIFLSPDSDITASSQLGVSGNINISILNLNTQNVAVLPTHNFVSQAPVIASTCLTRRNTQQGHFVVTGNGGLSETPDSLSMPYDLVQVRSVNQLQSRRNRSVERNNSLLPNYFVREATGFTVSPDGRVILVDNQSQIEPVQNIICATNQLEISQ